jgi:hypothetical protein
MTYAQASLIQDVRHWLQDNPWETTSTTTGTGTPVAVPDGAKWAAGDVGEWTFTGTAGGEQFLVQSVSANNLTVVRGYNGTTAEAHTSGDRVVKNPIYSVIQIKDAVDRIIESVYPSAWKQVSTSLTPDTTTVWFDSELAGVNLTGFIDVVRGEQRYGDTSQYVGIYGATQAGMRSRPITVVRDMPTALVASGVGVRFPGGFHHATNEVTVRYRARLTSTVAATLYSDLDEGLLSEAVVVGVVARLLAAKEVPNVSEDARLGQSDPGTFIGTAGWFELKHRELLAQYRHELQAKIPAAPDQNYIPGWWS